MSATSRSAEAAVEQTVEEFGRLDILVNNAAEQHPQTRIEEITAAAAGAHLPHQRLRLFLHDEGGAAAHEGGRERSSTRRRSPPIRGSPSCSITPPPKARSSRSRARCREAWSRSGIRVNAVAPGPIWTPLIPATLRREQVAKFGADVPMGRAGRARGGRAVLTFPGAKMRLHLRAGAASQRRRRRRFVTEPMNSGSVEPNLSGGAHGHESSAFATPQWQPRHQHGTRRSARQCAPARSQPRRRICCRRGRMRARASSPPAAASRRPKMVAWHSIESMIRPGRRRPQRLRARDRPAGCIRRRPHLSHFGMRIVRHVSVRGRVQGVGYRAFVEHHARQRGLEGWVRNRSDGSVEAVVAGAHDP